MQVGNHRSSMCFVQWSGCWIDPYQYVCCLTSRPCVYNGLEQPWNMKRAWDIHMMWMGHIHIYICVCVCCINTVQLITAMVHKYSMVMAFPIQLQYSYSLYSYRWLQVGAFLNASQPHSTWNWAVASAPWHAIRLRAMGRRRCGQLET